MIDTSRRTTLPARVKALEAVVLGLADEYRRWLDDAREYQRHLQNILDMLESFAADLREVEPPDPIDEDCPF